MSFQRIACVVVTAVTLLTPGGVSAEEGTDGFVSAVDLLPASTAGLVRFTDLPDFCLAAKPTNLGQLLNDPALDEFKKVQEELANEYLGKMDKKIGMKIEDVYAIASGEVAAAWIPYPKTPRRPYAFCVIADIRGRQAETQQVLDQIDVDMQTRQATRVDVTHAGEKIRVYSPKAKVGQLKIEQIAIWVSQERIIASDRDTLVQEMIDVVQGNSSAATIATSEDYIEIMSRSATQIRQDAETFPIQPDEPPRNVVALQWYAQPFVMGQIVKQSLNIDRGTDVEILKLLQNQGFDAIRAAGGTLAIGVGPFDWLHRGVVLAPPTVDGPDRYRLAAKMLKFPNEDRSSIPDWVPVDAASFLRMNWKVGDAFLALETLVDEAFGTEIFQKTLQDIKEDELAAGVDILNDVVPNLGDQMLVVTDNTLPIDINSERLLVAIELTDADAIGQSLQKIMEAEPDVSEIDTVPGLKIWQFQQGSGDSSAQDDLFGDFDDFQDDQPADEESLLPQWAVTLVPGVGKSKQAYLLFASHTELLTDVAVRMRTAASDGQPSASLATTGRIPDVLAAMRQLEADPTAIDRVVRLDVARRSKYELFRTGQLKNSSSVLASLIKRILVNEQLQESRDMQAGKLPPFPQIEKYFTASGSYVISTDDGWTINGFVLKSK